MQDLESTPGALKNGFAPAGCCSYADSKAEADLRPPAWCGRHEVGRGGAGGGRGRGRGATELGGRGGDGRGCGGGSHGPWARPGLGRRGALWPRWRRWRRRRGESPLGRGCATASRSRRRWLCGRRRQKKVFFLERGRKGAGRTSVRVFFYLSCGTHIAFYHKRIHPFGWITWLYYFRATVDALTKRS